MIVPFLFEVLSIVLAGLVLGSFATALAWRIPRSVSWKVQAAEKGKGFLFARSACPSCGAILGVLDLVPLFSWIVLRGKCRHCGAGISARYPVTELVTLAACLAAYAAFGFTWQTFFIVLAVPFLCALFLIDWETMLLPDELVFLLALLGFARLSLVPFVEHLAGFLIFPALAWAMRAIFTKLMKRDVMGLGDIKFFAVAGLWLGLGAIADFYVLSGILGVVLGLAWKKLSGEGGAFPFGPALIAAFYTLLLLDGSLLL